MKGTLNEITGRDAGIVVRQPAGYYLRCDRLSGEVSCFSFECDEDEYQFNKKELDGFHVDDVREYIPGTITYEVDEDGDVCDEDIDMNVVLDENDDIYNLYGIKRLGDGSFRKLEERCESFGGTVWELEHEGVTVIVPDDWY